MIKLSRKTKLAIFKAILQGDYPFGKENPDRGLLDFLSFIWDLRAMPSDDPRFNNAYDDIFQHTVRNSDWDIEYLFLERLKLLENNENYNKFLLATVDYQFKEDESEVIFYVDLINSFLEKENYILSISDYDDNGFPVYILGKKDINSSNSDLPPNRILFYVIRRPREREREIDYQNPPKTLPAFKLIFNNGWNDYSRKTSFNLYYFNSSGKGAHIGELKITNGTEQDTDQIIPLEFLELNEDFCSIGQNIYFYNNLKNAIGHKFMSVLYALKDAAFFPDIHDKFEKNDIFNTSLIRYDEAERILRQAKHEIEGSNLNDLYSFQYIFQPKYSKESMEVNFDFSSNDELPNRIYAIIGKNGTGKTQLITTLPVNISKKKEGFFIPNLPLFSKVIAVSYSIFDNFEIPKKTSYFNYIYCGLLDEKKDMLTERQQVLRFHKSWKRIEELVRTEEWLMILQNFIEEEILDSFVIVAGEKNGDLFYKVERQAFNNIKSKLSSGQSMILYIITEIIANIRLDSLILFDEPETHLHPNAISQLMNTIYDLVNKFESYCIITTHSPLIIQEVFAKNVYIMERHEDIPSIRHIGIESFGENLSVLTEEVFGNKEIGRQYKKIIDRLVEERKSYGEILEFMKSENISLSLNARLYLKSKTIE